MFTMMNTARLMVGIQGLGVAEAAYQGAVTYAKSRLQMRAATGAKFPDQPADPIIVHPGYPAAADEDESHDRRLPRTGTVDWPRA